jgi:hypothetical protein
LHASTPSFFVRNVCATQTPIRKQQSRNEFERADEKQSSAKSPHRVETSRMNVEPIAHGEIHRVARELGALDRIATLALIVGRVRDFV